MQQDEKREHPNMTATEAQNAMPAALPTHGIITDMVDREAFLLDLVVPHHRLTPTEALKLWQPAKRD